MCQKDIKYKMSTEGSLGSDLRGQELTALQHSYGATVPSSLPPSPPSLWQRSRCMGAEKEQARQQDVVQATISFLLGSRLDFFFLTIVLLAWYVVIGLDLVSEV